MLSGSFYINDGNALHVHTNWRVNVLQTFGDLNRRKNFVENDNSFYTKSNICLKRKLLDLNPQVDITRMSKSKVARSVNQDDQANYSSESMNESNHIDSSKDMPISGECFPVTASEYETLNNKLTLGEMKLAERKMKVTSLEIRLASMEQKLFEERLSAQSKDKKIFELEQMLESKNRTIDDLTKLNPSKYLVGKGDVNKLVKDFELKLNAKETLVMKLEESFTQKEKCIDLLKSYVSELEVKLNDKDIYINTLEDSFKTSKTKISVENDLASSGQSVKNLECSLRSESDLANSLAHDHGYANSRAEDCLITVKSFANKFRIGNVGNILFKDEVITLDENF